MRRSALWVDEPEGPRWALALELLTDGEYVVCMGLGLTVASESHPHPRQTGPLLKVRVQTNRADSLTAEHALAELENAEAGLNEILRRSAAFSALVANRQTLFELIDDYGMGAIRLAYKDASGFHYTKVQDAGKG